MTPGLSRASAVHSDAGQQQGRPRASCPRPSRRGCVCSERMRRRDRDRRPAVPRRSRTRSGSKTVSDRRRLLQGIRRAFAADGALLRAQSASSTPSLQVAMRDVYAHPTVRRLARALDAAKPAETAEPRGRARASTVEFRLLRLRRGADGVLYRGRRARASRPCRRASTGPTRPSTRRLRSTARALAVVAPGSSATTRSPSPPSGCSSGAPARRAMPLWSFAYFRFWAAKQLVHSAPANAFAGTPLYNLYLRLLGAKIGASAVDRHAATSRSRPISSRSATTPSSPGARYARLLRPTAIASTSTRSASAASAYVGEASVLDIRSAIGDFGQLGHASSLQQRPARARGQALSRLAGRGDDDEFPACRRSAQRPVAPRALSPPASSSSRSPSSARRRTALITYGLAYWAAHCGAIGPTPRDSALRWLPIAFGGGGRLLGRRRSSSALPAFTPCRASPSLFLREGRVYPLYGFHHSMQRMVADVQQFGVLQSAVRRQRLHRAVSALGRLAIGRRRSRRVELRLRTRPGQSVPLHDRPRHGRFGRSAARQLHDVEPRVPTRRPAASARAIFSAPTFTCRRVRARATMCMLATKVMAPIDGPLRENVGLLGSPCFEIPRAASRDLELLAKIGPEERRRRLARKTGTMSRPRRPCWSRAGSFSSWRSAS